MDQHLHARIVPTPPLLKSVGYIGLVISLIAPFLAVGALLNVRSSVRTIANSATKGGVWVIVIIGVIVACAESLWSCGGHPTWYMGFAG